MGIPGIYGEIGPGERVALVKLAIDKFEKTGRPLRVAIDISIWQFQIQSGRGGSNPAIRTLYFRLLRLLSVAVQPLFVFDGPHKPKFKRNRNVGGANGGVASNFMTKELLKLFGFQFHTAPGEAEAECALLQREGLVDAVLSEDVDTLMFGCGLTLRNWSSEGARGNKSPTHVSVYEAEATKNGKSGLDREGMILVALMSGGDYDTDGIPGCGIKLACQAARAGFGKSLCKISRTDAAGLKAWRENLALEIQTNESKLFKTKHKALKIPEDFPNREVLGFYTHPVVSSSSKIAKLKSEIIWDAPIKIVGLRQWVAEVFGWRYKSGAYKFIRGLAPGLLVQKLRIRGDRRESGYGDLVLTAMNEMELVRAICGKRSHFDTDGMPELRLIYCPCDIVGLDLEVEEIETDNSDDYGRDGLAPVLDDDMIESYVSDDDASRARSVSPTKRGLSLYDPAQPDELWVAESIAKVGIPLKVEDYEESQRDPKKFLKQKAAEKRAAKKTGMPKGALDRFVTIGKPVVTVTDTNHSGTSSSQASNSLRPSSQSGLPPVFLAPSLENVATLQSEVRRASPPPLKKSTRSKAASTTGRNAPTTDWTLNKSKSIGKSRISIKSKQVQNPWTKSQTSSSNEIRATVTKIPGRQDRQEKEGTTQVVVPESSIISLLSSPLQSPKPVRKHLLSPDQVHHDVAEATNTSFVDDQPHSSPPSWQTEPSQRKKRTPPSIRHAEPLLDANHGSKILTPEPANRRLKFSRSNERHGSGSPELPALQEILSPQSKARKPVVETKAISLPSSPEQASTRTESQVQGDGRQRVLTKAKVVKTAARKKVIMLRESLPGAWKEVDEDEVEETGSGRVHYRRSGVEMIDLTES